MLQRCSEQPRQLMRLGWRGMGGAMTGGKAAQRPMMMMMMMIK